MSNRFSTTNSKTLRIGIDAKWYFSGPPSGRVVVQNIVDLLLKKNLNHHFVIFVKADEVEKFEKIAAAAPTKKIEVVGVGGKFNFLQNMFILPKLALRHKVDVMFYQNFIPLFPSKEVKNVDFILDFLFMDYPQYFSAIENRIFRIIKFLSPKADHIGTISHSEKARIIKHANIPAEKITVVHLGANENFRVHSEQERAAVRAKYNLPENFVLYIGRLNIRKNIPTLMEAISLSKSDYPLVIIGKKESKSFDFDKSVTTLGIQDRTVYLGYIPEEDMAAILSAATVFCFPSFAEGFGLPPLEAFKSGTPVITTNSTSIPEVCGDAAVYFDPYSAKDLSVKLDNLIEDTELRNDMINKGLERAKMFSWSKASDDVLDMIQMVGEVK